MLRTVRTTYSANNLEHMTNSVLCLNHAARRVTICVVLRKNRFGTIDIVYINAKPFN